MGGTGLWIALSALVATACAGQQTPVKMEAPAVVAIVDGEQLLVAGKPVGQDVAQLASALPPSGAPLVNLRIEARRAPDDAKLRRLLTAASGAAVGWVLLRWPGTHEDLSLRSRDWPGYAHVVLARATADGLVLNATGAETGPWSNGGEIAARDDESRQAAREALDQLCTARSCYVHFFITQASRPRSALEA